MRIRSGIVRIVGGRFEEGVNGKLFLDDRDYNSFILSFDLSFIISKEIINIFSMHIILKCICTFIKSTAPRNDIVTAPLAP